MRDERRTRILIESVIIDKIVYYYDEKTICDSQFKNCENLINCKKVGGAWARTQGLLGAN